MDDIIIFDREVVVVVVVLGGNDTTNLCQPDDTSIVFPKAFFIYLSLLKKKLHHVCSLCVCGLVKAALLLGVVLRRRCLIRHYTLCVLLCIGTAFVTLLEYNFRVHFCAVLFNDVVVGKGFRD